MVILYVLSLHCSNRRDDDEVFSDVVVYYRSRYRVCISSLAKAFPPLPDVLCHHSPLPGGVFSVMVSQCGHMPIHISSDMSLAVSSRGSSRPNRLCIDAVGLQLNRQLSVGLLSWCISSRLDCTESGDRAPT